MEHRGKFGRTMMQALELLWLAKGTPRDEATLNSEEIKPVAIAIIELRLSEGISKSVSQSVSRKFCSISFKTSWQCSGRV